MDQSVWRNSVSLNSITPDKKSLKRDWTLSGSSKAALRTGFKMGPFYLDAGHSVFGYWNVCLISHGHADHIFSLASFCLPTCPLDGQQVIIAPNSQALKNIPDSLIRCNNNDSSFSTSVKFVEADRCLTISIGKETYVITPIKLDHGVPTYGYAVSKKSILLNPEYMKYKETMSSKEFGTLVKKSEDSTVSVNIPQFCYITDTSIKGLEDNIATIITHPIVIVECTYYDNDDIYLAKKNKHIHFNQLNKYIKMYRNTLWVLVHHSAKYPDIDSIYRSIGCETFSQEYVNCLIWKD